MGPRTLFGDQLRASETLSARQRLLVVTCFLVGGFARLYYALILHPAQRYLYSDMQDYWYRALNTFRSTRENISDTLHPPGMSVFLAALHHFDPTWKLFGIAQAVMSIGVVALVWLVARRLYGRTTALVALLLTTLYFPFVHYTGFFLTENPFTFFCLLALWLFIQAIDAPRASRAAFYSGAAGLAAGLAVSFKTSIFAPMLSLGIVYIAYSIKHHWSNVAIVAASTMLGLAVLMLPMSLRCTRLSEGRFCPAASNLALNVLMGHYGEKGAFYWHDRVRGIEITFESPTTVLQGYKDDVDLDFGAYDSAANLALALRWSADHPLDALRLSLTHVYDLVAPRTLWPRAELWGVDWGAVYQWAFWLIVLPAAIARIAVQAPSMLKLEAEGLPEWLLVVPPLGLVATAFVTIGEVRYRIPFDGLLIVLAARSYVSMATSASERPCR